MRHIPPDTLAAIAAEIRAMCADDEQAFLDTLDGETDAIEAIDKALARALELDAHAAALGSIMQDMTARKRRMEASAQAMRQTCLTIMQAISVRKLERPAATLSVSKGRASVQITDPGAVPSQLMRVKAEPDKAAIKKQLEQGEAVPGCELVEGSETITVRTK